MSAFLKPLLWIGSAFVTLRVVPHLILFHRVSVRPIIEKDVERWLEILGLADRAGTVPWRKFLFLLRQDFPEYRTLLYYRIGREKSILTRLLLELAKHLRRPREVCYLRSPSIGPGLFIQHGFSLGVGARSIGENCWVNQQITIGWDQTGGRPTIGNNVMIAPGAQVFGEITIGDNVIIGANAVVCKNVPPNCTVVGVPAYIIKRDGKKTKEPL